MTKDQISQDWEKEFDEKFNDNFVYWQELAAEIHIGDPDFKSVKAFIKSLLATKEKEIARREILDGVIEAIEMLNTDEDGNEIMDSIQDAFTRQNIKQNVYYFFDQVNPSEEKE